MSEWIKCTGADGSGTDIFVNLCQALTMSEYGSGTRIALAGNGDTALTYVDVAETPQMLLNSIAGQDFERAADRSANSTLGLKEADYKPALV